MATTKNEEPHTKYYNSFGIEVPSCTNIIKLLNKPELVGWANYMGFRRIDVNKFMNEKAIYGTDCHTIADAYMTGIVYKFPDNSCSLSQFEYQEILSRLGGFRAILESSSMEIVYTEMELHGNRFGGTLDLLCKNNHTGEYTLFDYKTSKRVYDSHLMQLGGYSILLEEIHGIKVSHVGVVLLSKEFNDKDFVTIIKRENNKKNEDIFNKLLDIYWIQHN